ncbi:MAG TPA: AMP-binding protein [Sphaerochaeta sp.]|jgi:long-chain acyl-CoA synthetase|nr:AMP-binding protein [Sphaerochaeta sp.]
MYQTIPQIFFQRAHTYAENTAQMYKTGKGTFNSVTYSELAGEVESLASALLELGIRRGSGVGLISDNRKEWLVSDLAILSLGAADVPRGRDAMPYEVSFILSTTEAEFCFVENEVQLNKVLSLCSTLPLLKTLIVMDDTYTAARSEVGGVRILRLDDLVRRGRELNRDSARLSAMRGEREKGVDSEVATIIFTSGTTGDPKGVMLTHANFAYQLEAVPKLIEGIDTGQRWLSVLPVWHSFERILQYVIVNQASTIAYSKPLGSVLLADLGVINPHFMGSVPRIWEAVRAGVFASMKGKSALVRGMFSFFVKVASSYSHNKDLFFGKVATFKKRNRALDVVRSALPMVLLHPLYALGDKLVFSQVKAKLGTSFIAGVSGGGSLPEGVDLFFASIGIKLLDGYGLTESAPVVGVRPLVGGVKRTMTLLEGTEARIVDGDGRDVEPGEKGVLFVRGPQVMKGYYKRPDLTEKVLSSDGWLDTGDLAMWTHKGEFAIAGRAKDTIVLSGGENLEPIPIEAKLCESEYIESAVVLGQDKRYLGALIVLNRARIEEYLNEKEIPYLSDKLAQMAEVKALIERTVAEIISSKHGFKSFEHIVRFTLLGKSFEVGRELSAKQELKRFEINRLYEEEIADLFAS